MVEEGPAYTCSLRICLGTKAFFSVEAVSSTSGVRVETDCSEESVSTITSAGGVVWCGASQSGNNSTLTGTTPGHFLLDSNGTLFLLIFPSVSFFFAGSGGGALAKISGPKGKTFFFPFPGAGDCLTRLNLFSIGSSSLSDVAGVVTASEPG